MFAIIIAMKHLIQNFFWFYFTRPMSQDSLVKLMRLTQKLQPHRAGKIKPKILS
jgi:hypothetical protein